MALLANVTQSYSIQMYLDIVLAPFLREECLVIDADIKEKRSEGQCTRAGTCVFDGRRQTCKQLFAQCDSYCVSARVTLNKVRAVVCAYCTSTTVVH